MTMTSTSAYGQGKDYTQTFYECEKLGQERKKLLAEGCTDTEKMAQLKRRIDWLWSNLTVQEKNELVQRNSPPQESN